MIPFSPVEVAHRFVQSVVQKKDRCVDATVGNGHDTAFLSGLVGNEGQVLGFDVQEDAIEQARRRLFLQRLDGPVILKVSGHEFLSNKLKSLGWQSVRLIMFNLGYLPGSDKSVITKTDTTMQALNDCLDFLDHDGAISIVAYRGHSGGAEEFAAVQRWVFDLPVDQFFTVRYERWTNQKGSTPVFFWTRRRAK